MLQFRWMKVLNSGCVSGLNRWQWHGYNIGGLRSYSVEKVGKKNSQYSSGLCLCDASQIPILESRHYLWGVRWSPQLCESTDSLCDWSSARPRQSQPPPSSPPSRISAADDIIRGIFGRASWIFWFKIGLAFCQGSLAGVFSLTLTLTLTHSLSRFTSAPSMNQSARSVQYVHSGEFTDAKIFVLLFCEHSSDMTLFRRRKKALQEHHDEHVEVNVVQLLYRPADWTTRH